MAVKVRHKGGKCIIELDAYWVEKFLSDPILRKQIEVKKCRLK